MTNAGGYGRFYSDTENTTGATTAINSAKKILTDTANVSGLANSTEALEKLKQSIISSSTNVGKNITNQLPGVESASANAAGSVKNLNLKDSEKFQSRVKADIKPPLPNILSYYSSYNYIFTLSVLSPEALNFPDLYYRKGIYGPLILRSGGGAPDKELVPTAYGKYDFYIDDLKLNGVIGLNKDTGNTNSSTLEFRIIEPYSMGLFFQALQAAALASGYGNYLDVPVLLTIDFKGHIFDNDTQLSNISIDNTTKQIPLKLSNLNMKVTGKGTTYDVKAYAWNEQGFSTQYNQTKADTQIFCNDGGPYTVQSMLQTGENSLQKKLNDYFQGQVKKGAVEVADQILILFPADLSSNPENDTGSSDERKDKTATTNVNDTSANTIYKKLGVSAGTGKNTTLIQATGDKSVNKIGQAEMGFNVLSKGDTVFPKDAAVYDEKLGIYTRGKIVIDPKNSTFKFSQGASVVDIINQVILMSDYGRNALSEAQRTPQGQIVWWRIETQMFTLSPTASLKSGLTPKLVVFRVVPYYVDSSYILPVNVKRPKLDKLADQSLKEYNYIYTGKNTEVLDFNIEFNTGFYTALNADGGKNSEDKILAPSTSSAATSQSLDDQKRNIISASVTGSPAGTQQTPMSTRNTQISTPTYHLGGGGPEDATVVAARQFQNMITQGSDMITLDLNILGDPYYLGDSGMGNYSSKGVVGFQNINSDGAIDYQSGAVVVKVNFRTPIDLNQQTGFYNFGDTAPVAQFSGLFQVTQVESDFSRGKFKQQLKMFRVKGQDNPNAEEPSKTTVLSADNANESIPISPYASQRTQQNTVNPAPPNPALPGVVNSGGVTI